MNTIKDYIKNKKEFCLNNGLDTLAKCYEYFEDCATENEVIKRYNTALSYPPTAMIKHPLTATKDTIIKKIQEING